MDERVGKALWLLVPALLIVGAMWGWARYTITDRFSRLASEIHDHDITLGRGVEAIPDEAELEERILESARELEVEVADLEVHIETLRGEADFERAEPTLEKVRDELARVSVREYREGDSPGEVEVVHSNLELEATRIEVHGTVRTGKWLWSGEQPLEVFKTIAPRL